MKIFQSGVFKQASDYKYFLPKKINRQWIIDDPEITQMLSIADRHIGRLDMFSEYIPNINLFISLHLLKEATQSNKIEGTETNIEDALLDFEDVEPENRNDWEEVKNYMLAMDSAIKKLEKIPFSNRLIKESLRILLDGVRGRNKQPGNFRKSQNWIGGATLNDAIFIPPLHSEIIDLMADLELFVHNESFKVPELIKIAIVHYQFETIHPFLDGNGRVGRLIITLYLVSKGILKKPVLYLSDFFENHRQLYYDNLMRCREKNDIRQWFRFFLTGVIETSKDSIEAFNKILRLKEDVDKKLLKLGTRSNNAIKVMDYLYQKPMINAKRISKILSISMNSSYKLLTDLQELNILNEVSAAKRSKNYIFTEYLRIFK